MAKRSSYDIRIDIITVVREGEFPLSKIEKKVDTNYYTVKKICEDLADLELVKIRKIEKDPANGKPSYHVSITQKGRDYLEKVKSKYKIKKI